MGSDITDDERNFFEDFIAKHEPYDDDDPVLKVFHHPDHDSARMSASIMKKLLSGELSAHGPACEKEE